jgi:sugar transferase (PEP-CTERM/EpsH1 system associated)
MRDILFLAHRAPWPPDRGDKIRSHHLLRHLSQRAHIHLAAFIEEEDEADVRDALSPFTASIALVRRTKGQPRSACEALATGRPVSLTAFDSPALQRAIDTAVATHAIDTAFVFSSQMAHYVDAFAGRIIMDFVDVDSAKFAAYADAARGPMRWMMRREARLLLAHDAKVARRAEASLFVSEAEAAMFRSQANGARVHVIENGIDTDAYDPAIPAEDAPHPLIVFTGQMDYRPNIDAVAAFAKTILPVVRAAHPNAHFAIVGRNPAAPVRALAGRDGLIVTGEVPDVRPWLAAADIVVAPLILARGIQNKVLEAMAMARPVVASPQAAEGIDHAGTIRVAGERGQARAVLDLLNDPAGAEALGQSARARVILRYGWDARLAPLDALMGFAA